MRSASRKLGAAAALTILVTGSAAAAPLELATGDHYEPFTAKELPEGGMATAIVRAVYDHLGRSIRVTFLPWKRAYAMTLRGRFAATFPYIRTDERDADYLYSAPIYTVREHAIVANGSPIRANSVDDLAGKTYCLPNGYAASDTLAAMRRADQLTRTTPPSMAHCMQLLDIGRVDFVVANAHVGRAAMAKVFGNAMRTRFLDVIVANANLHVLFPRTQPGSEAALRRFNEALAAIRENGRYAEVVRRFVGGAE